MHSEYKILSTIISESESVTYSAIMFRIVKNIDEFYHLMQCLKSNRWDWSTDNVADVMDKLRSLNSDIHDEFFWKNWDIQKVNILMKQLYSRQITTVNFIPYVQVY